MDEIPSASRRRILALGAAVLGGVMAPPALAQRQSSNQKPAEKPDTEWCNVSKTVGGWKVSSLKFSTNLFSRSRWEAINGRLNIKKEDNPYMVDPSGATIMVGVDHPKQLMEWLDVAVFLPDAFPTDGPVHLTVEVDGTTVREWLIEPGSKPNPLKPRSDTNPRKLDPHRLESYVKFIDGSPLLTALSKGSRARLRIGQRKGVPMAEAVFDIRGLPQAIAAAEEVNAWLEAERPKRVQCTNNMDECYITTAVCAGVGLSDDCFELRTLRAFRDGPLMSLPGGAQAVARYYATAPAMVAALRQHWSKRDWQRLYAFRILPCALLAKLGLHRLSYGLYARMVGELARQQRHAGQPLVAAE